MHRIKYLLPCLFFLSSINEASVLTPIVLKGTMDGSQWTLQDSLSNASLNALVQNQTDLIAVGQQNNQQLMIKSSDGGITWTTISPAAKSTDNLNAVYANNQDIIAVGNDQVILVSHDNGAHWQMPTVPAQIKTKNAKLTAIAANGADLIAVGQYNPYSWVDVPATVILVSHNQGDSWVMSNATLPAELQKTSSTFSSILWDGQQWIATGSAHFPNHFSDNGFIITSPDGINWTYATLFPLQLNIKKVATNGKDYFAISNYGSNNPRHSELLKSVDHGKTWNWLPNAPLPRYVTDLENITWNGQIWLGVGTRSRDGTGDTSFGVLPLIMASPNGESWLQVTLPSAIQLEPDHTVNIMNAVWNGQNWVAVGMYNKQRPGCESFAGHWAGTLTAQGMSINVKPLGFGLINGHDGNYTIGSGSIMYHFNSSEIGEGLGGTCTEQNGIATLSVFNNNPQSSARLVATEAFNSDVINIISSNLSDGKTYRNFVGTLRRDE